MIYGAHRYAKHPVRVLALEELDGTVIPVTILWDDGRRYDVTCLDRGWRQRCTRTAGFAVRYRVLINGRHRELYHGDGGWFVEVPDTSGPSP